jgi:DNA-binding response OmpR family regulator
MLARTPLERENQLLREKVEVLEETVRQYVEREHDYAPLPDGLPKLTPQEETLLRAFLRSPDVVSRERLYHAIYRGENEVFGRIVDVHLTRLRRKLKPLGYTFVNHWGRGWRLERPVEEIPTINRQLRTAGKTTSFGLAAHAARA